ncbi:MAG: hypothetical protein V7K21_07650 [Nostoc sp.]|uniref:OsmC family protein n=1 Tax=Nostoc sp. TaxID=1180 RepID=UPI002FF4D1A7
MILSVGSITVVYLPENCCKPVVTVKDCKDPAIAKQLHEKAHHLCFIANSMNFPVRCEPSFEAGTQLN